MIVKIYLVFLLSGIYIQGTTQEYKSSPYIEYKELNKNRDKYRLNGIRSVSLYHQKRHEGVFSDDLYKTCQKNFGKNGLLLEEIYLDKHNNTDSIKVYQYDGAKLLKTVNFSAEGIVLHQSVFHYDENDSLRLVFNYKGKTQAMTKEYISFESSKNMVIYSVYSENDSLISTENLHFNNKLIKRDIFDGNKNLIRMEEWFYDHSSVPASIAINDLRQRRKYTLKYSYEQDNLKSQVLRENENGKIVHSWIWKYNSRNCLNGFAEYKGDVRLHKGNKHFNMNDHYDITPGRSIVKIVKYTYEFY